MNNSLEDLVFGLVSYGFDAIDAAIPEWFSACIVIVWLLLIGLLVWLRIQAVKKERAASRKFKKR